MSNASKLLSKPSRMRRLRNHAVFYVTARSSASWTLLTLFGCGTTRQRVTANRRSGRLLASITVPVRGLK